MGLSFSVFAQLEAQGEKALARLLGVQGKEGSEGSGAGKSSWIGALWEAWGG